jgi:DNA polymerase
MTTIVDFEARSRANLKKVGGRRYWAHPSSEALVAVLHDTDTGEVTTWVPGEPPPRLETAAGHNGLYFDRFAAERYGWAIEQWLDTAQAARRAGLPGALDALAKRWLGRNKDKEGNKLTVGLSRPSRAKARFGQLPDVTPEILQRVAEYCADDVQVLADAWPRLSPWFDVDADACAADQACNDRGMHLDQDLVRALQRQIERGQNEAVARAAKALGMSEDDTRAAAMSPQKFGLVTGLPNAQKGTLSDPVFTRGLSAGQRALVAARQALASIVPGKLEAAMLRVCDDSRLRDSHHYCGAHTWRWSSKGLQHHNFSRATFEAWAKALAGGGKWPKLEDLFEWTVERALAGCDLSKYEIDVLNRGVFIAGPDEELGVLDYSGIEARCLVWAADDHAAVDVFRALDAGTGPDPYKVMAAEIFRVPVGAVSKDQRGLGKKAELMLGYGAGGDKFADSCAEDGVDLEAFGLSGLDVRDAWRKKHAQVVKLWKACERAYASACEGRAMAAGPWTYEPHAAADGRGGCDVWCVLPSGRPIVYPNAKAKPDRRGWGWDMSYTGGLGFPEHVYGGLLVENAVQATCRDLLADSLVRCERAGLRPVLHVHDELVCGLPKRNAKEAFAEQEHIMSDAPSWADGLPVRLDGFRSERYRK